MNNADKLYRCRQALMDVKSKVSHGSVVVLMHCASELSDSVELKRWVAGESEYEYQERRLKPEKGCHWYNFAALDMKLKHPVQRS